MNENHKRVLSAYLYSVEKNLRNVRRDIAVDRDEPPYVLYEVKRDLDLETRITILDGISNMLKGIKSMKDRHGLQVETESSRSRTLVAFTEIWTTISDLRPKNLENYGPLTAEDWEEINVWTAEMFGILDKINSSL